MTKDESDELVELEKLEKLRIYKIDQKIIDQQKLKRLVKLRNSKDIKMFRQSTSDKDISEGLKAIEQRVKPLVIRTPSSETHEWLRILHERYSERFLKDNDRIWTVSSIFIPLSLAGLSSIKDGTLESTVILAAASIGLILFWYLVCEKHRAFQDQSKDVVEKIEDYIGLEKNVGLRDPFSETVEKNYLIKWLHALFRYFEVNIQRGRELILYLVVILWVSATIYVGCNKKEETKGLNKIIIENKYLYKHTYRGDL